MIKSILFDMDGVLVDFEQGFREAAFEPTEIPMDDINGDPVGNWLSENAVEKRFFEELPPMPDFEEMRELMHRLAFNFEVRILSSCGKYHSFEVQRQKRVWLKKYGLDMVQFNWCESSYQKAFFADRHTLLIDDREESCLPFIKASGHAILHTNYKDTSTELDRILYR